MIAKLVDGKLYKVQGNKINFVLEENGYKEYSDNHFALKEDGTEYEFYNEDGTPYFEKIMVEDKVNLLNQMETAIQTHIDEQAQTLGYDDINSIAKYLRPSSPFYDECVKLGDWCDACWAKAYEVQMEVEAGTRELPEDIISELPSYEN